MKTLILLIKDLADEVCKENNRSMKKELEIQNGNYNEHIAEENIRQLPVENFKSKFYFKKTNADSCKYD